jgi:2-polyprenyl-3-methyl-5-hydroxy-6-metoxy-1,4-benzoquinol methylase
MSKYETEIDLTESNTSHNQMLELVGHNKRVLDVGCASGYMARVLAERGCDVSGVESDPDAAEEARPVLERLVVGDLDKLDLVAELGERQFDIVLFGDVLEHLRDPLAVLRQARPLLVPGGSVVISVPNVGHGAVRLALLKGEWRYQELGLLDATHLRFFTHANLSELFRQAGFIATDFRRTFRGIFDTEIQVREEDYPPAVIEALREDPESTTYQFVVRAVADDGERQVAELAERAERDQARLIVVEAELERLRAERMALAAHAEALEVHIRNMENSRVWRLSRLGRRAADRLRGRKPQ